MYAVVACGVYVMDVIYLTGSRDKAKWIAVQEAMNSDGYHIFEAIEIEFDGFVVLDENGFLSVQLDNEVNEIVQW